MSAATPLVLAQNVKDVPQLEIAAFRSQVLARLRQGQRALGLYGRPHEERVLLTAVLLGDEGLSLLRTSVNPAGGYHELTSDAPSLHVFERELHDALGVRVAGHPWLKPVRYQGKDQAAMSGYPFYRIEGKELHEVNVGPIHAGVIEPGAFRFTCFGEQVLQLEIQLGYQHRGAEAQLLGRPTRHLAPLVETLAGDTSAAHAWAHAAALEALCPDGRDEHDGPAARELPRAIILELERVAMHLAGLSGLAADVGFLPGASTYGRLRTTAINTSMRLCGSRFSRGAIRPLAQPVLGGAELARQVAEALALLRRDLAPIDQTFLGSRLVRHRLADVGRLPTELASQVGLVGMAARASGVAIDLRSDLRDGLRSGRGAFAEPPLPMHVEPGGDCLARARLRVVELGHSLRWLEEACQRALPSLAPARAAPDALATLRPCHLAVAAVEGWRGEVLHCVETDERGAVLHYKAQDPSLRNWTGLALALRGNEISDFPICNKSFDLSYCGNDL